MIKRLTRWSPREGLSREEALRYWKNEHAALVARVPGVQRYVQNHCTAGPDRLDPPYAGLGEVWFVDHAAAEAAAATREWKAVLEDAATFMDMSSISAAWAEEHVVV